jgi:hypothetical protein
MAGRSRNLSSGNMSETTTQKDFTSACKSKMAWERLKADSEMIKRSFLQYGIFIHPDGSEDHLD